MTGRFVLKIGDHLDNAETKRYYTERNFSEVAPRYDFITRALSFGRDAAWKRILISSLPSTSPLFALIRLPAPATSRFVCRQIPGGGRRRGVDINEPMG